jgi:putative transposase
VARRKSTTNVSVQIIHLHDLSVEQASLCDVLRREAGRCWTDLVNIHKVNREKGFWMRDGDLKKLTKGGQYLLHANTIQSLAEKLIGNVRTAQVLRQQQVEDGIPEEEMTKYPYLPKDFQTVTWKGSGHPCIRIDGRTMTLNNGRNQVPLVLTIPSIHADGRFLLAELCWSVDHYVLHLTVDTEFTSPKLRSGKKTAGVDLGEVNIAAVVVDDGEGIVISGRYLRSVKRLRNKRHDQIGKKQQKCLRGSKRWNSLEKAKRRASAKADRQERDILHKASEKVVTFCEKKKVATIAIGDVRDIGDKPNLCNKSKQKVVQWSHGQFTRYVTQKARVFGMKTELIGEAYTTKACSHCGHVKTTSPKDRNYRCSVCGARVDRDGNGAANILSLHKFGELGKIPVGDVVHLMPMKIGKNICDGNNSPSSRAANPSRRNSSVVSSTS